MESVSKFGRSVSNFEKNITKFVTSVSKFGCSVAKLRKCIEVWQIRFEGGTKRIEVQLPKHKKSNRLIHQKRFDY